MKQRYQLAALGAAAGLFAWAGPATGATTLIEIYQQALQSDPVIREADARRLAALEARPRARGRYLPQLNANGSVSRSNSDGKSARIVVARNRNALAPVEFTSETKTRSEQWQLSLRQTLFRWDQIVGLRQAEKQVVRAETVREYAQQNLIVRVVERYFNVLAAEDKLLSIHANRQAIARQLEQAKQRFEVGLIAITDVQESQAAFDQATANEIAAKRDLATAREFLREITGAYSMALAAPNEALPLRDPEPLNETAWIDLSLAQNLDLNVSRIDEQLARDEINSRRSGHLPTLDLVASYGKNTTTQDQRIGSGNFLPANSDIAADSIGVEVTIPLFSGGQVSSRVREAVYLYRAAREVLQRVTRETERRARDAYLSVVSDISRVHALRQAVQSNRTALEATEAGFAVGTRTIVQVLDQQFQLYDSIVQYYRSRYDYILNYMRLKQTAGTLSVQDLEALEPFLVARKTPEEQFEDEAKATAAGEEPAKFFEGPGASRPGNELE